MLSRLTRALRQSLRAIDAPDIMSGPASVMSVAGTLTDVAFELFGVRNGATYTPKLVRLFGPYRHLASHGRFSLTYTPTSTMSTQTTLPHDGIVSVVSTRSGRAAVFALWAFWRQQKSGTTHDHDELEARGGCIIILALWSAQNVRWGLRRPSRGD